MRYCPSLATPWPHMPLTLHTPQALMLQRARASLQLLPHRRYMVLCEHMAPPPPLRGLECCLSLCTLPAKTLKPLPHQQPHTQLLAWLLWHRHYTAMLCLMMVTMATPRAAPMAVMAAPTQPTRLAHTA